MAIACVAVAMTVGGAIAANAETPVVIAEPMSVHFRFGLRPSKVPAKPTPVRLSISGRNAMEDGSHVPALREVELNLSSAFSFDVSDVPVCAAGSQFDVRPNEIERRCADAAVGKGKITLEVAIPEQPLTTVTGSLTIYNRGHNRSGTNLVGWAYFPAPVTGGGYFPIRITRTSEGLYKRRVRIEVPKLAGGYGSVAAYSMHLDKGIVVAACRNGRLTVRADSTFVDGDLRPVTVIRPCVPKAHARQ